MNQQMNRSLQLRLAILVVVMVAPCFAVLSGTVAAGTDLIQQPSADAERIRGIELYRQGDANGAVEALRGAVKTNRDDAEAWHYLGLALLLKGSKDEARAALRALPDNIRRQIGFRLHLLQQDFSGDLKKLNGSKNEYRLHVRNYRCCLSWKANELWSILSGRERTFINEHRTRKTQDRFGPLAGFGSADCRGQDGAPATARHVGRRG